MLIKMYTIQEIVNFGLKIDYICYSACYITLPCYWQWQEKNMYMKEWKECNHFEMIGSMKYGRKLHSFTLVIQYVNSEWHTI